MDDEEKQSGNDSENLKIECKSKRSINVLLQKLKDEFVAYHVQQNKSKEVDSESVNRKIYQTYRRVLLSNVLVDGQVVNDLDDDDTTSEFEPIDTKKEDFIKNDLINGFDQQLVITTRLRKTGPHTMKSHMKKIIRPELKYLAVVNVILDKKALPSPETDVVAETVREDVEARLRQIDSTLESTKQSCDETLIKSKDLLHALKLYQDTEMSETYRVMCETPPRPPFAKPRNKTIDIAKCEINKRLLP